MTNGLRELARGAYVPVCLCDFIILPVVSGRLVAQRTLASSRPLVAANHDAV